MKAASFHFFACSGPGALTVIQESIIIGNYCAAIGIVVTLALAFDMVRNRSKGLGLLVAAGLVLIHPAWTISAYRGDCGYFKRNVSYAFTVLHLGLLFRTYRPVKQQLKQGAAPNVATPRR